MNAEQQKTVDDECAILRMSPTRTPTGESRKDRHFSVCQNDIERIFNRILATQDTEAMENYATVFFNHTDPFDMTKEDKVVWDRFADYLATKKEGN